MFPLLENRFFQSLAVAKTTDYEKFHPYFSWNFNKHQFLFNGYQNQTA